jgi:hypothetical protein
LVIVTSLIGILVFTAATQQWFINRLKWYETIAFLIISLSFLAPDYVLGKFYPKFNEQKLSAESIQNLSFDPSKEVHIKSLELLNMEKDINYLLSIKENLKIIII